MRSVSPISKISATIAFKAHTWQKNFHTKKTEHVSDILLVCLFVKHLRRYLDGEFTNTHAAGSLWTVLEQAKRIKQSDKGRAEQMKALTIQNIPDSSAFNKKILNGALSEHVFLMYNCIHRDAPQ